MSQIKMQFMKEAGFQSSYPLWRTQFVFVSTLVLMKFSKLISFDMDELHTVGKLWFEKWDVLSTTHKLPTFFTIKLERSCRKEINTLG
jgi:hypothetical protein